MMHAIFVIGSNLIGKSKKTAVLAGAHKKFERCQHTEMYLQVLKAQDKGKMKLPLDLHGVFPVYAGL